MSATWDYIVIGAGHNGFTAACTLALAGNRVLIVEQRQITGGLSASHAYLPEAPQHLLSIGAMDDALMAHSPLVDYFRLCDHGYSSIPLNAPYGWMGEHGETLVLHKDFKKTVDEIHYFSAADAKAYVEVKDAIDFVMGGLERIMPHHPSRIPKLEFGRSLLSLVRNRSMRKIIGKMLSMSAFEMIAETFESEAMRGLWAYWTCMFAPATVQASGLYLAAFGSVHRAGIFRPKGGMSGMISAFENLFHARGGEIRLSHPVEQLLFDGKRVVGVRIRGGEELFARHGILANCAPQVALGRLIAPPNQDDAVRSKVSFIPANSAAIAPYKIDIAVGGLLAYPRAQRERAKRDDLDVRKTTFMTGTLAQHISQHQAALRGESLDGSLPLYFSVLSANDSSIAPPGQDVFYLYANAPVDPVGGWAANRQSYASKMMASLEPYIEGLDAEIGRVQTTPRDFEESFGAPNGAYFHVDMLPTRMGMNRPARGLGGYRTPYQGLYLASAGSHPSGGICGWPGKLAAETALQDAR